MGLDDIGDIDSVESGSNSSEISEKYKEQAKKASAGIKRTQKDEKRARKYDFLLAKFLVEMILKKKYDSLLDELFSCLDAGYGTNFLLGIMSLIYLPISSEIRKHAGLQKLQFSYEMPNEEMEFSEQHIPKEIQGRINAWIEDMNQISTLEVSEEITTRSAHMMIFDEKIRVFTTKVFVFFFCELKISISETKAKSYAEFILTELQKNTKKSLAQISEELTQECTET